jgi:hypothetical protein
VVLDSVVFLWYVETHFDTGLHDRLLGRVGDRLEMLRVRPEGTRSRLDIAFRSPRNVRGDRVVLHSGQVVVQGRGVAGKPAYVACNLFEPGVVRALVEVALERGWQSHVPADVQMEGWDLLDVALRRRACGNMPDPEWRPGLRTDERPSF